MIIRTCLCLALFIQLVASASAKTFTIGLHERPFYREKTYTGDWEGADIALVKAIFSRTPFEYELIEYPWRRTLQAIETGKVDIALSAAKTAQREKFAWFTDVQFRPGHNVLYLDKQKLEQFGSINSLDAMLDTNFKLGVIRGISYSDRYDELRKNKHFLENLVTLDSTARLPQMLLKGRIDGYLDSEFGGSFRVLDNPLYKHRIILKAYITSDIEAQTYLMFSKLTVSKDDVEIINRALLEVQKEGIYEKVLARYGLKPQKINFLPE